MTANYANSFLWKAAEPSERELFIRVIRLISDLSFIWNREFNELSEFETASLFNENW